MLQNLTPKEMLALTYAQTQRLTLVELQWLLKRVERYHRDLTYQAQTAEIARRWLDGALRERLNKELQREVSHGGA